MKLVDFLPVELQEVELVTVELDSIFAHSFELALEPFARRQAKPIIGVAKLDRELGGKPLLDLLLDLLHRLPDLGHGLARLDGLGGHTFFADVGRILRRFFGSGRARGG